MRYTLRIMIIIFMGISLTVLSFSNSLTFNNLDEIYEISPNPKEMKMTYNLYFVAGEGLEVESREIQIKDNQFLTGISQELLSGPKNKLLKSPFTYKSEIISAEIRKSTLFLNLQVDILNESFWHEDDAQLYIWSLVNTYTELDDVIKVQILVDGKKIDKIIANQNINKPLMRNDSLINNYNDKAISRVLEFINLAMISEYEEGYKLLSTESKRLLDFKSFILFYDNYIESLNTYREVFHYYQEEDGKHAVYLKFSSVDPDKEQKNKVEKFNVVKEGSKWYIDFVDMLKE